MNGGPDDGLRARFDALREADGRRVPAFRAMLGRRAHASPPAALPRRAWLRALVLAAAAAIVLALGLTITPGRGDFAPSRSPPGHRPRRACFARRDPTCSRRPVSWRPRSTN